MLYGSIQDILLLRRNDLETVLQRARVVIDGLHLRRGEEDAVRNGQEGQFKQKRDKKKGGVNGKSKAGRRNGKC